jgi:hypothetical protein
MDYSDENFNIIWELKDLETLELSGWPRDRSNLNNLHKLKKLKRLEVNGMTKNILNHLRFGVFNNLEELAASFRSASLESVQEMKWITPKLKKIKIVSDSSDTINVLLETLDHLEDVNIFLSNWEIIGVSWLIPSEKVHPKIKKLDAYSRHEFKFSVEQLTKTFPNLEFLEISSCRFEVTEPFFITLLSGLKRLKTLHLHITSDLKLNSDFVLPCFEEYGNHLETVNVSAFESESELTNRFDVVGFKVEKEPDKCFRFSKIYYSDPADLDFDSDSDA